MQTQYKMSKEKYMPHSLRAMRNAAALAGLLLLAACATGANTAAMVAPITATTMVADSAPAHKAIVLGDVTGGHETNPLWTSQVSTENFKAALEQSLQLRAMTADSGPRYQLNAELLGLDQPLMGLDLTVVAKVHYTVVALPDQSPLLDTIVETPYTAKFSDAFVAVERLRLANEGAIRVNIDAALVKILAKLNAASSPAAKAKNCTSAPLSAPILPCAGGALSGFLSCQPAKTPLSHAAERSIATSPMSMPFMP